MKSDININNMNRHELCIYSLDMKNFIYICNEMKVLTLVLSMWLSNTSSASEIIFNFETEDGFTVSNQQPNELPGPFFHNTETGSWISDGSDPECIGPYDSSITSPEILIPNLGDKMGILINLDHRYSFEPDPGSAWDIGQILISLNDMEFKSIGAEYFTTSGYSGKPVAGSGIAQGQIGFSDESEGYSAGEFITDTAWINVKEGDKIKIKLSALYDQCATGNKPNWEIDKLTLIPGDSPYVPASVSLVKSGPEGFSLEVKNTETSELDLDSISLSLNGEKIDYTSEIEDSKVTLNYFTSKPLPVADPNYISILSPPEAVTSLYKVDSNHSIPVADIEEPIIAEVVYTNPAVADVPLKNASDVSGKIGLCDRGATYFDVKGEHIFNAGGVASIIANNRPGAPIVMGTGRALFYDKPHFMISQDDGNKIKPFLTQGITISISPGHKLELVAKDKTGKDINGTYKIVVSPYTPVEPKYALGDDIKGDSGILSYVTQISNSQSSLGTHIHDNAWTKALTQFQGKLKDGDGEFYLNEAEPDAFEGWTYLPTIVETINFDQGSTIDLPAEPGSGFFFGGTLENPGNYPDDPIPGIPGWFDSDDGISAGFFTLLELPVGKTILGITSDDGIRATFQTEFGELYPKEVAVRQTTGTTVFTIFAEKAGLYPFKLLWWEGTGGANVEFYSITEDGKRILVNDSTDPNSLKAYIPKDTIYDEAVTFLPSTKQLAVVGLLPVDGGFSTEKNIELHVREGTGSKIDESTIKFTVNGESVDFTISSDESIISESGIKKLVHVTNSRGELDIKVSFTETSNVERVISWKCYIEDPIDPTDLNLLAYYSFDSVEDGKTYDSENNIEGVLTANAKINKGAGLRGLGLDSTDDPYQVGGNGMRIEYGEILNLASTVDAISITFWAKNVNPTQPNYSSAIHGVSFGTVNNNGVSAKVPMTNQTLSWDTSNQPVVASFSGTYGTWNHYAFIKDGQNKKIYVNGDLIIDEDSTLPLPKDFSAINVLGDLNAVDGLEGHFDELAIFASPLTEELVYDTMTGEMFGTLPSNTLISKQPEDSSGELYQKATFTIEVSDADNMVVIWFYNGSPVADGLELNLIDLDEEDQGGKVKALVFSDKGFQFSEEVSLTVTPDITPPELVSFSLDKTLVKINLSFSEAMDTESITDVSNYSIDGLDIEDVSILGEGDLSVLIETSSQAPNTEYTLDYDLKDAAGNSLKSNVVIKSFLEAKGYVNVEYYLNISGTDLASLYNDPLYESGTFTLERFIPETNTKFVYGGDDNATWDNYGAVMSGYIIAPETGEYRFFFHSDDSGELYLSTDTTEDNLELICSVTGWANTYVLDDENERSALVNLEAGKKYLFQAIWKEGGGGDNCGISWRMPSETDLFDTPPNASAGIPGEYLATYAPEVFPWYGSWFPNGIKTINSIPQLSTLSTALEKADITLAVGAPYDTIFAPTNEAFDELPDGVLDSLLADPAALADILKYHIINSDPKASGSNWWVADVLEERAYNTALTGKKLTVSKSDGGVQYNTHYAKSSNKIMINNATVLDELDSSASSVIIIDKVLLPPDDEPPSISINNNGDGTATVTFTGTLQTSEFATGPWSDVEGESPITWDLKEKAGFARSKK